jgi:hypothetical protein
MIKFRIKEFTIPEGHYSGTKDLESIPGYLGMAAKGALGGAGVGAVISGISKDKEMLNDVISGAKYGAMGGIVAKFFLNYLHKPMNHVKYQEVDKAIRRHFGVFSVSGFTVGDSIDKRANINEKFEFNDRDVAKYKLNFAIHDNTVTMYTFGMTKAEFDKVNNTLDYYCKKYFSMEYSAKAINAKVLAYAVDIVFTNYQVICDFILELSKVLETKINLLDNNAIITGRLEDAMPAEIEEEEEKKFSWVGLNKYDLNKILSTGLAEGLLSIKGGYSSFIKDSAIAIILEGMAKLGENELAKYGVPVASRTLNNEYLKDTMKRLHYVDGFNYSIGDDKHDINMSLVSGVLIITVNTKNKDYTEEAKELRHLKNKFVRSSTGPVDIYSYKVKDKNELDFIIKKIMSANVKPNIFEK